MKARECQDDINAGKNRKCSQIFGDFGENSKDREIFENNRKNVRKNNAKLGKIIESEVGSRRGVCEVGEDCELIYIYQENQYQ